MLSYSEFLEEKNTIRFTKTSDPEAVDIYGRHNVLYKLTSDYRYDGGKVPKGFVTDWASIPEFTREILDLTPEDVQHAGLIHDWEAWVAFAAEDEKSFRSIRKEADKAFKKNAIELDGVSPRKAAILYRAVRLYSDTNALERYRGEKKRSEIVDNLSAMVALPVRILAKIAHSVL